MVESRRMNAEDIMKKYGARVQTDISKFNSNYDSSEYSKSYLTFKQSISPDYTSYEKMCKSLGNLLKFTPSKKDKDKLQKSIDIAHLNISAAEAAGLAVVSFVLVFILGFLFTTAYWLIFTDGSITSFPMLMFFLVFLFSIVLFFFAYNYPQRLATIWRLKASSQMVPAILYVVIYMKHTSNFEKAVAFAAEHLDNPLAMDFKKVFWDVEVGRFSSLKESMDYYLETWRDYSLEFIEAFHLIESSLYEPSESRRVSFLEKSLQVILDGVYDKMLKYTHNVKSPLTNLYMLGIVLPTLSLAILPLASTLLGASIQGYHLFVMFNLLIPFFVVFMTQKIILERPGGHGEAGLIEKNPLYSTYKSKQPYVIAALIAVPLLIAGLLPLIWMYSPINEWAGLPKDVKFGDLGLSFMRTTSVFGIFTGDNGEVIAGPISSLSLILSLLVPLSIALFFIISYKKRTALLIKDREKYNEVEGEFTSSLFQLGNRLGDGLPPEIAFSKVLESTRGTSTEGFFRLINQNIQQLGMSVEQAIFNPRRGAIVFYPSHLIETSMKVLIESSKKGLQVAARSLMSISDYVKNIKKIDARLTDLLADIISDMKSNMTFLAPLLSGIIVGLSGMIVSILSGLKSMTGTDALGQATGLSGALSSFNKLFEVQNIVSPYWVQVSVGIYLIEVIFILTTTLVVIKSGKDELQSTSEIASNLKIGMTLYVVVAALAILGLTLLSSLVVGGVAG
ncbi:Uncharacterised protein [uncultured archaeon]|nr:Uncharacterised protein [uncultured archaeon]